jgi:hypothetical protein
VRTRFDNVGEFRTKVALSDSSLTFGCLDLFQLVKYEALLENLEDTSSASMYVSFSYPQCCGDDLSVQNNTPAQQSAICMFKYRRVVCSSRNEDFVMDPGRLMWEYKPVLEVIVQESSLSSHESLTGPFAGLHRAFNKLAELYTKRLLPEVRQSSSASVH